MSPNGPPRARETLLRVRTAVAPQIETLTKGQLATASYPMESASRLGKNSRNRQIKWRITSRKAFEKPGPSRRLSKAIQGRIVELRRKGLSVKTILAHIAKEFPLKPKEPPYALRTVERTLARHHVNQYRFESKRLLAALKFTGGAQRLDLARVILDVEELARIPAMERTVSKFEDVRGVAFHRNQLARMAAWCKSVGIRLSKSQDSDEDDPRIELDAKAVKRVITRRVIDAASAIKLEFDNRNKEKAR